MEYLRFNFKSLFLFFSYSALQRLVFLKQNLFLRISSTFRTWSLPSAPTAEVSSAFLTFWKMSIWLIWVETGAQGPDSFIRLRIIRIRLPADESMRRVTACTKTYFQKLYERCLRIMTKCHLDLKLIIEFSEAKQQHESDNRN